MYKFLDDGLDELAARSNQGVAQRLLITFAVAAIAATMLPWRLCLTWVCVQSLSEATSWIVCRPQSRGVAAGAGRRVAHLISLACGCLIWMVLGGLLWAGGGAQGAVSATILWLSVIFFTQTNAYQSPTGFLVGGALPGAGLLIWLVVGPNPLHMPVLPVFALFAVALAFACDGVFRALAARRQFDDAQAQLKTSDAQYRVLADNITDVIALNAMDGHRVYISPSVGPALGYPVEKFFDANFSFVHPDDTAWLPESIARIKASGESTTLEYRLIHSQGHAVWMEGNFSLIGSETGEPLLMSVSRNITARKAMETELVDARRRAEAAAAAKSDFLANMTHELRTPLNAIIGFSGVLKGSARLQTEDARHVGLIHDASGALLDLVNSVLDFSKLEAGAVTLETRPFDPAAAAQAVTGLLTEQARAKGLSLTLSTEGRLGPLVGDGARLRQVLLNFLSNALKFTASGGVTVRVIQDKSPGDQGRLRVEVTDTGIGVTAAQVEHLFDRFTQADASVSREYGGTGLGLAICKRTIELMGGEIGADSRPGEGSTFWFELTLPRADALLEDAEAAEPEAPDRALRLLLVEDVAVNRELILTLLRPFDVEIETAENGVQAVEAMTTRAYDLVLMDVQMPIMDGLTATRAIRALAGDASRATPIIAMTANVLPEQVAKCLEAGMDDHLGKPISPQALLTALSRWSSGRESAGLDEVASA